jgi:hypothetical protein
VHNSLQILVKNLELARKQLALSTSASPDVAEYLVGTALKDAVSAFDGFGREICSRKGATFGFQNLDGARQKVKGRFGFDFADVITLDEWDFICRLFQKRHLLAHKFGVIDAEYIRKAKDPGAVAGRKVQVSKEEVDSGLEIVEKLGRRQFQGIL